MQTRKTYSYDDKPSALDQGVKATYIDQPLEYWQVIDMALKGERVKETDTDQPLEYWQIIDLALKGQRVTSVYVYPAPLRLWHWITALCVLVLCVTGYLIGKPPPTLAGEASAHFLFGYIRFVHFSAGYVLAVGLLFRIYWTLRDIHARYMRELFVVPVWDPQWWREFVFEMRWYLFLERYPRKYIGHNPVGQMAMFLFFVFAVLMSLSGFALYGEGLGQGSWAARGFGWVITLLGGGNSLPVHSWHRLGMWAVVVFIIVHIYAAVREDIMSRQSMISTMLSGFRMFKS